MIYISSLQNLVNTTGILLENVTDTLQLDLEHSNDSKLKMSEADELLLSLEEQQSNTSIVGDSADHGSNRTKATTENYQEANSAVYLLCARLSAAAVVDPSLLNTVQELILELNNKHPEQSETLYSELQEAVAKQQERRWQLQREVEYLQNEISILKQLTTNVPDTCDSI